jgi:hypothetical protein
MNIPPKSSLLLLWTIAFTLIIPSLPLHGVRGQTDRSIPETRANSEKQKEAQELEKRTRVLLNDLAAASWSLKLPENRLFIMTGAADLLWSIDEKRARTVYWDALNALNLISASIRTTEQNLPKEEQLKLLQRYVAAFGLRQKLLRQVAKRNGQLALDMLRASRQVPPRQVTTEYTFPDDIELEQAIASEVAARDPAQALQMARQNLAKGITLEVLNLLDRLNEKDSEKGLQFAGELIAKLRTVTLASDFHASIVAVHLLRESRTLDSKPQARLVASNGGGGGGGARKLLTLSDEQKRELVQALTDAALSASVVPNVLWQVYTITPEIEQFFPERSAAVAKKLSGLNRKRSNVDGNLITVNASNPADALEEIVRRAGAAGSGEQYGLYLQAAMLAVVQGKTDWLREVISKELDPDQRAKILDRMDSDEISVAAYRKQFDRLQALLPKITRKEERARAMIELSLLLKEKGEDEKAAATLDEAATLIKTDLTDEKQTYALLSLLCAYAVIDPPKAFALAERTVDHANSQISLLLLLDKVVKSGAVKKNEIVLEQPGIMPLDFLLFKYGKGVAALAKADFNRTKALTERFERNELKLMAQLLVLKGLLESQDSSSTPAN